MVPSLYLLPVSARHEQQGYLYLPVDNKGECGGEGQPLEKGDHTASIHRQEILVIPPIAYRTRTALRCSCDSSWLVFAGCAGGRRGEIAELKPSHSPD